jgi:hypothetical protein
MRTALVTAESSQVVHIAGYPGAAHVVYGATVGPSYVIKISPVPVGDYVAAKLTWPTDAELRATKDDGGFAIFTLGVQIGAHEKGQYYNPNRGKAATEAIVAPIKIAEGGDNVRYIEATDKVEVRDQFGTWIEMAVR